MEVAAALPRAGEQRAGDAEHLANQEKREQQRDDQGLGRDAGPPLSLLPYKDIRHGTLRTRTLNGW